MQKYIYALLTMTTILIIGCGGIKTEPVVLPQDQGVITPIVTETETSEAITISNKQFNVDDGQDVNIDLSTLITEFDSTEEYFYIIITPPTNGLVSIQGELMTFTPASTGADLIEFKVSTSNGESNVGQLSFTINKATEVISSQLILLNTDLNVLENQQEAEELNLASIIKDFKSSEIYNFSIVTGPSLGIASISGLSFTYIPFSSVTGTDTITLRAGDGDSTSNIAVISVEIQNLSSSAPKFDNQTFTVKENTPLEVDLLKLLLPPHPFDSKTYTFSISFQGKIGSGVISGSTLTYTPITNALGEDTSMRVVVKDELNQTDEVVVTFKIEP